MMKSRTLVTILVAALALLGLSPATSEAAGSPGSSRSIESGPIESGPIESGPIDVTLNAKVFDGGQQIVSVTLDTSDLRVRRSSLTKDTFTVQARGEDPYGLDPATVATTYDLYRTVTGIDLDRRGRIVIDLAHGPGVPGASTLAWAAEEGRNIVLDQTYTVNQRIPIKLSDGRSVTLESFRQGGVVDREVDAYQPGEAAGLHYRLFRPSRGEGERPLIVWLHGGGEGGWAQAQDNDLTLQANRGALGFSTRGAQRIFGGAYVLAPQATDYWLNDPAQGYSAKLKELIDSVVETNRIDPTRIYVAGASNGGYMAARLAVDHPDFFAAVVPVCPALIWQDTRMISDAELATLREVPTWIVQARNDPVLPFDVNGQHMADAIGTAELTAYEDVTRDGVTHNGHASWIYVARNDPSTDKGLHIWEWMAQQRLS